ncbi:hypothetical protein [Arcticibacterium luteifluviistationis]|uniref:Uncharacterized protein n=1 Tax=Arcticibacterium luteifluviistationis TaxID=1784714 RepID=A0A2Z4G6W7_9BACT|nr:hypothetical protein [Arcticibacterium luteifluviistationis]AWV96891.1 hypothetical protein DJ013_01320 [Arcticibacterium luteifluviistationis]
MDNQQIYKKNKLYDMGINVRGIATSIKTKDISELTNKLGLPTPTLIDKTYFENAISNSIENNEIFLTISSKGTILTVGDEVAIESMPIGNLSLDGKAMNFIVGETSMIFAFDFYENGELLRSVINAEDQNLKAEGELLDIEHSEDDFTELIFSLMETVSGDSIYTLEPDAESVRYKFILEDDKAKDEITDTAIATEEHSIEENIKPWWKFW